MRAALDVVEVAVYACRPLSCEQYQAVCGAAALLAYVAREAEGIFQHVGPFFRSVPDLFQIDWSCSRGLVEAAEGVGDGWE